MFSDLSVAFFFFNVLAKNEKKMSLIFSFFLAAFLCFILKAYI